MVWRSLFHRWHGHHGRGHFKPKRTLALIHKAQTAIIYIANYGAISGTSTALRGLPIGAEARPFCTAAMSSSLG
jgi:hypothetical protein